MSDEEDYSGLTGDALTWALHRENRSRWRLTRNELLQFRKVAIALLLILLTAQLTGFHVVPDPTIHLHWP